MQSVKDLRVSFRQPFATPVPGHGGTIRSPCRSTAPSPDDSPTPTSPGPNLQKMLTGADADGDGRLDYGELANIDEDLYIASSA